jgi:glycosyltransferase involved in cell wall biosynthesis
MKRRNTMAKWKRALNDELKYSRTSQWVFSAINGLTGTLAGDEASRLAKLLNSFRFAASGSDRENRMQERLARWHDPAHSGIWREARIGWDRFKGWQRTGALSRTVVLKAPSVDEKGVLLVTFEYNWFKLLKDKEVARRIESRYDIIFSTSSSPSDYAMLGLVLSTLVGPVYVMACNYGEIAKLEKFHPRIKCLPMLPCDWLDPANYRPKRWNERAIDILMVAGWGPVKRHWHFFDALRSLPADLKVVLVGQPDGAYDRNSILRLAEEFGVPQKLEVLESLDISKVSELQCDSRISTIFSRREGCCVAVAESLMADSPVALIEGAHMGPCDYINEGTGCFLPLRGTGAALREFLETGESYRPREWALRNIANTVSADKLGAFLETERAVRGEPWSGGLVVPSWKPHPMIPEGEPRRQVADAFAALHRDFPGLFPEDLIERSRL